MPPTRRRRPQNTRRHRRRRQYHGGKTFAANTPVKLAIMDEAQQPVEVRCEVCRNNHYTETIGTINKSKVRAGIGSVFFGEAAEFLDTTSIIVYFCNYCGHARIIRNNSAIKINAYVASPDEILKPIPAKAAAEPPLPPPPENPTQKLPPPMEAKP